MMNNPFKILGVDRLAEKRQILQQAMVVLQQNNQYDSRSIAEAQKSLFSPLSRATAEFMHCLDTEPTSDTTCKVPGEAEVPQLTLLEIFNAKGST